MGVKVAEVGSPELIVIGHQSMAFVVTAGTEIVVVMVYVCPTDEDRRVVVNPGHLIVVVWLSWDGDRTIVQGAAHETVGAPPLDQIVVGAHTILPPPPPSSGTARGSKTEIWLQYGW
jgi:hypothetical protein